MRPGCFNIVSGSTSLIDLLDLLRSSERALDDSLSNLGNGDLTSAECLLLALLAAGGARLPSDLARISGLSRGRITQLADGLIDRGLVSRRADRKDRRKVSLLLTTDGRGAAEGAKAHIQKLEGSIKGALGSAGMDMLAQHLRQLINQSEQSAEIVDSSESEQGEKE